MSVIYTLKFVTYSEFLKKKITRARNKFVDNFDRPFCEFYRICTWKLLGRCKTC